MTGVAVALAAGLGAVCRYLLDQAVTRRTGGRFPAGTLAVNTTGSLLLGLVAGLAVEGGLPSGVVLVLGTGFAGGYTTLSTWAWESLDLARKGAVAAAAVNVVGSLALGLAAAALGLGIAAAVT